MLLNAFIYICSSLQVLEKQLFEVISSMCESRCSSPAPGTKSPYNTGYQCCTETFSFIYSDMM